MLTTKRNRKNMLGVTALFLIIAIILAIAKSISYAINTSTILEKGKPQIIIDAGHGGVDPGAVCNNVPEKDINLNISLTLRDMLIAGGYDVIMVRDTDIAVNDKNLHTIGKIKSSDLKNRLKLIENHNNALAISIHQNKYPDKKICGAQMFYGRKNDKSKVLAGKLQESFKKNLQPSNTREVKRSTSSVYILHNAKNPIVLVECGFLSNDKERELLSNEEYQAKIAFCIFEGITNFEQ